MDSLAQLIQTLNALPIPCIVGIDGCGGAGKSTLAAEIARHWEGAQIVHTDDFASWDRPLDWWPRVRDEVLIPLSRCETARFQKTDWVNGGLGHWQEVAPGRVLVEGVSAIREEFRPYLSFRIWVEAPRDVRLHRGLERDGAAMEPQWREWMAAEDAYVLRQNPAAHADLVVPGF